MKINKSSIRDFVAQEEVVFSVPEFQRPYSWTPENADDFIADLEECAKNDKKVHYFGTIFYNPDKEISGQSTIIDGQQRITTTMLMLTAIYHLLKEAEDGSSDTNGAKNTSRAKEAISDANKAAYGASKAIDSENKANGAENAKTAQKEKYSPADIVKKYLLSSAYAKVKLRAVAYDNRIFQDIFDTGGLNLSQEEKRSNLWQVYRHFRQYFGRKQGETPLSCYIDALKGFKVISIGLGEKNDDDPQRVFESINSTGKPLTDGDKIRNFALMLDNKTLSDTVYRKYWSKIENALTDPDHDEITDFFRNYLIAKRQAVIRTDEVYNEFKKLFRERITEQTAEEIDIFYQEIVDYLKYYAVLVLGEKGYERTIIPEVAYKMRYIRAGLYVPFGMSVMHAYENGQLTAPELEEVFSLIETYFSRRLICNISASSLDKVFATLHKNVMDVLKVEEKTGYGAVLKFLILRRTGQTRMPDDKELQRAIFDNDFYHQRLANVMYVLTSVNDGQRKKESATFKQVSERQLKLSIEHVMPQTIDPKDKNNGAKWVEMLGEKWQEIHATYLHTLGNLTLTGYNTEYSNRPYLDAKHPERSKMYLVDRHGDRVGLAYSDLALNSYIARNFKTNWGENEIKKRDRWFLKSFQKLWPYPETDFVPTVSDTSVSLISGAAFTNCQINVVNIFGDSLAVGSWAEALDFIAESLYEYSPETFKQALDDEYLSTVVIKSKTAERGFSQVLDTNYYVRTDNSTNAKIRILSALARLYSLSDEDIRAEISKS